ncbi:hypothetical protein L0Y69_01135 [bacterium]|nr:hypothetical protein [bacterium]
MGKLQEEEVEQKMKFERRLAELRTKSFTVWTKFIDEQEDMDIKIFLGKVREEQQKHWIDFSEKMLGKKIQL